jgi:hypothetical protein
MKIARTTIYSTTLCPFRSCNIIPPLLGMLLYTFTEEAE